MADADIIELLNGVDLSPRLRGTRSCLTDVNQVYLDLEGAPTDRFLEELRSQENAMESLRRSLDNADMVSQAVTNRRASSWADADDSSDSGTDERSTDGYSDDGINDVLETHMSRHVGSSRRASSMTRANLNEKKRLTKRRDEPSAPSAAADRKGNNRQRTSSGRMRMSADDMVMSLHSVGGGIGGKKVSVKSSEGIGSRNRSRSASSVSRSTRRVSSDVSSPHRNRNSASMDIDTPSAPNGGDSAMQEKMKTYRLRVSGQLQTIRSLEVKLGETELELRAKDSALTETRSRLQALERRERNSFLRGAAAEELEDSYGRPQPLIPPATRERDAIRKLKTQVADLQDKLKEASTKIKQGNERYRIAKSALERSTNELSTSKAATAKAELTLSDTQNALIKSRREAKEVSAHVEALKGQIEARTEAEKTLQLDLVRAEGTLRELRVENEGSRSDLNRQSKEIGFLQESSRRMELELRLLRERDAVHKLEKRAVSKVVSNTNNSGSREVSNKTSSRSARKDNEYNTNNSDYNRQKQDSSVDSERDDWNIEEPHRPPAVNGLGMESVLAWEKDYAARRKRKMQRGESLSPPGSPARASRGNSNDRDRGSDQDVMSSSRPIAAEGAPSASAAPSRARHPFLEARPTQTHAGGKLSGRDAVASLESVEQVKHRHDRLQQMYDRVTKGKGTSSVTVA